MMRNGFTLSEILITLAILGVCLAIGIPLLAQQREKSVRNAAMKEVVLMLSEITREGVVSGDLTISNLKNFYFSRINANQLCDSGMNGCWDVTSQGVVAYDEQLDPGLILPNGVRITGFDNCCNQLANQWHNGIAIDWNGTKGPNLMGEDQLHVQACFGPEDCTLLSYPGYTVKVGTIGPNHTVAAQDAQNLQLWLEIFK
jgi:prepilin-type N-terminal cleavage/methylation domain-containing protein